MPSVMFCILCFMYAGAFAGTSQVAPMDPEFLQHRGLSPEGLLIQTATRAGRMPTGYVPSPLDLSHVKPPRTITAAETDSAAPSAYDLRSYGHVTPVRDQGPYGTCWAFGALASLESSLLKAGRGNADLSEWHLAYFAYKDEGDMLTGFTPDPLGPYSDPIFDQGGESWMSTAILSRWTGAVNEADRPYQSTRPWPANAAPLPSDPVSVYLENVLYLGGTFDGPAVKNAIMTYGAVAVSMKWDSVNYSPYNETHSSFYIPEKTSTGGHTVTLAGWDDNYPVTNFNIAPPSKGAWLVKNSWGERWGDGGYFWLSYSDPNIKAPAVFLGSNGTNFKRVYQYDPNGWTGNFAPASSETAWLANVFQASGPSEAGSAEVLEAVSFYAGASETSYRIEVRTNLSSPSHNPRNGVLAAEKEGVLPAAGYHTVKMPAAVLQEGSRFSIVLRLTTPGYKYPVPVEMPVEGYSEKAKAGSGQSFVSTDGTTWSDITGPLPETNVCIKAFTSDNVTTAPPSAPSGPENGGEGGGGGCSAAAMPPMALALAIPLLFLFRK